MSFSSLSPVFFSSRGPPSLVTRPPFFCLKYFDVPTRLVPGASVTPTRLHSCRGTPGSPSSRIQRILLASRVSWDQPTFHSRLSKITRERKGSATWSQMPSLPSGHRAKNDFSYVFPNAKHFLHSPAELENFEMVTWEKCHAHSLTGKDANRINETCFCCRCLPSRTQPEMEAKAEQQRHLSPSEAAQRGQYCG